MGHLKGGDPAGTRYPPSVTDPFGWRSWHQKPLRERLMPWPTYALLAVVGLVCGLYLGSDPEGLHSTGIFSVIFLVTVPCLLYLAALAYRERR